MHELLTPHSAAMASMDDPQQPAAPAPRSLGCVTHAGAPPGPRASAARRAALRRRACAARSSPHQPATPHLHTRAASSPRAPRRRTGHGIAHRAALMGRHTASAARCEHAAACTASAAPHAPASFSARHHGHTAAHARQRTPGARLPRLLQCSSPPARQRDVSACASCASTAYACTTYVFTSAPCALREPRRGLKLHDALASDRVH